MVEPAEGDRLGGDVTVRFEVEDPDTRNERASTLQGSGTRRSVISGVSGEEWIGQKEIDAPLVRFPMHDAHDVQALN